MKRFIYADNAATTQLDIDAFEAMQPYLLEEYGNASQPYSFARAPKKLCGNRGKSLPSVLALNLTKYFSLQVVRKATTGQ